MKIAWLGHACYRITSDSGLKIITDPYLVAGFSVVVSGELKYGELQEEADIVVVSHEHPDHNNVDAIKGNPEVVRGNQVREITRNIKGIEFKALPCYHDAVGGKRAGENNMIYFEIDGVRICHTGDLGHPLNDKQVTELGKIDVLLLSVGLFNREGNHFIIDTVVADALYSQLAPKVTIPGHFSNNKCTFKIAILDEFLESKKDVIRLDENYISEVELKKEELPTTAQIMVLKPIY